MTDGALRMIILLHAAALHFNAIEVAFMFFLYELMGVVTTLSGGVIAAKLGLQTTLVVSLFVQIMGMALLGFIEPLFGNLLVATPSTRVSATIYITCCQALAGVAKDLMKLSGKSVAKLVVPEGESTALFKLVAGLTGLKNALKGVGFFLGSLLQLGLGYTGSLLFMIAMLAVLIPPAILQVEDSLGRTRAPINFATVFRKPRNVNILSAARFWIFGSRDVWFEVAAPLFLVTSLRWSEPAVGAFMAGYIIIYGFCQSNSSFVLKPMGCSPPRGRHVMQWSAVLTAVPLALGTGLYLGRHATDTTPSAVVMVIGLAIFAFVFAVNSAVHSYLILEYSDRDKVAISVGFYYMANAMGRLVGTLLSGIIYFYTAAEYGLAVCLWVSCAFLVGSTVSSALLKDNNAPPTTTAADDTEAADPLTGADDVELPSLDTGEKRQSQC